MERISFERKVSKIGIHFYFIARQSDTKPIQISYNKNAKKYMFHKIIKHLNAQLDVFGPICILGDQNEKVSRK
jgi:hypothetical protein